MAGLEQSKYSFPFPPLPADTERATRSVFHIENLYLSIGDELDLLFEDVNWANLDAYGDKPASHLFLLTMVTTFQFAEQLSDQPAATAVRERTDWKYALHLPLDHPGLDPAELGEFRRRLLHDPAGREVFQRVLARLARLGLFGSGKRETSVADVLGALEALNRVVQTAEAMHIVLENLAASHPEWLQANSLPHWVERYGPQGATVFHARSAGDHRDLLAALRADIDYLLGAIARDDPPDLANSPEIQTLQTLADKESSRGDGRA